MKHTAPHEAVAIVVVVLIVIGALLYFLGAHKAVAPVTNPAPVTYSCDTGSTIVATYATNSVTVKLSDGRTLTLPQTQSASGIRYEANGVVFWSKGDNSFVTEGDKTTYNNCVAGTNTPATNGTKTFNDQGNTFSFVYPDTLTVSGGGVGYTQDWMVNATSTGLLLAKIVVPSSFEPKTNFGDATFTVGTSPDPSAVKTCFTNAQSGTPIQKSQVTIGGVMFTKLVESDAGAGNFYETTSYRVVRNNQCYAIEYTIHSTNISNYSPDQGITQFDKAKVQNLLEGIVQSFKFL